MALRNVQNIVSMPYLLKQLMDFDQTHRDTLLRKGEELIRFCDIDLIFKVTPAL